jgi:3,4-dihydroxy 2-butanone 4-phosphate synthase
MRRDACLQFGKRWGLKVCTIEDLVEYMVEYLKHKEKVINGINGRV